MKVVNIDIERLMTIKPFEQDYMAYHYDLHKGLTKMLVPRIGIDIVFLYYQPNTRSLDKKVRRFWHNYRKTVTKQEYETTRMRTSFLVMHSYEDSLKVIENLEASFQNMGLKWDFNRRIA
jgi:glycosylphosphatidylinositol transamidase (GPIT) subunit GPI8